METKLPPFFSTLFDASLPRLGPGSSASTRRALQRLYPEGTPLKLRILDVGCGNGTQTIELARVTHGEILAFDTHTPYLEEAVRRAAAAGVSQHVTFQQGDMHAPEAEPESFDLIWFEGSIFVMGFEAGLRTYHPLLRDHGKLAISDLVWFDENAPAECRDFLEQLGAQMLTVEACLALIQSHGFEVIDHFPLPSPTGWRIFICRLKRASTYCSQHPGRMRSRLCSILPLKRSNSTAAFRITMDMSFS
jgi:SAM-dependent methyltransferase